MKRLSCFPTILLLMFILGCQSQNDSEVIPVVTQTSTFAPTVTPEATLVFPIEPTQTSSIEFPDWVKNPETQILLVPIIEHINNHIQYEGMSLFNAETSARFDIPFTNKVGDYFWLHDGSGFGFLPKTSQDVIFFSIKDEKVTTIPMPDNAFKFINQGDSFSQPIQISTSEFDSPEFLFLPHWADLSPDRKHFIYYQEDYDGTYTNIFDIASNKSIAVSDPNDKYFDLRSEWSPTSPLLAIVQVDQQPGLFNSFDTFPTFRLRVYDVQSLQTIASYKNVTFPKWSPDGTKFLFQEWKGSESFYWYGGSPPCIFDTLSGETNCFNELIINDEINITSAYWSPDQSMISFVYLNYARNSNPETGSFCIIQLSTENISCLLAKLDIEEQNVIEYLWSPDSNFISFFYDTSFPISDYRDQPNLGIANIKTGKYFSIGLPSLDIQSLGLWRPSPIP